jgi:hypothetical protein
MLEYQKSRRRRVALGRGRGVGETTAARQCGDCLLRTKAICRSPNPQVQSARPTATLTVLLPFELAMDEIERFAADILIAHTGQHLQIVLRSDGVTYGDYLRLREILQDRDPTIVLSFTTDVAAQFIEHQVDA